MRTIKERVLELAGTMPDSHVADELAQQGLMVAVLTISSWRRQAGIPAYGRAGKTVDTKEWTEDQYAQHMRLWRAHVVEGVSLYQIKQRCKMHYDTLRTIFARLEREGRVP